MLQGRRASYKEIYNCREGYVRLHFPGFQNPEALTMSSDDLSKPSCLGLSISCICYNLKNGKHRNERRVITIDPMEMKRILKEYYKQLMPTNLIT